MIRTYAYSQKKAGTRVLAPIICLASACSMSIPTTLDDLKSSSTVQSLTGAIGGTSESNSVIGVETQMPDILAKLASGKAVDVDEVMEDDIDGRDEILARMERGRVGLVLGDVNSSKGEFKMVAEKVREIEDRAKISASDTGSHAAALVTNDTMIPYEPAGFEKVFAYQFQALNFLLAGGLEEAAVEVRRASAEQNRALKAHQKEIDEAEKSAKSKGFSMSAIAAELNKSLGDSKTVGASVKNSFQNAYTFYMSGVIREALGEANDAYIDYKKALEIAPNNSFVQKDVVRLAKALGMDQDLSLYGKKYPAALKSLQAKPTGVEVVILFEEGSAPTKQGLKFPIPIPIPSAPGLTSVAIPTIKASVRKAEPLTVFASATNAADGLGTTEPICNVDALVVKAYQEAMPAMVTRQIVRAAIKGAASSLSSKYAGSAVGMGVGLLNSATERADTRSWHSLPQNAQIARIFAPSGASLTLKAGGVTASDPIKLPEGTGARVIIHATKLGSQLYAKHVNL